MLKILVAAKVNFRQRSAIAVPATSPIQKGRLDELPRMRSREKYKQWSRRDSNPRHLACKASALPTELRPQRRRQETGFRGQGHLSSPNPVSCIPFPQTVGAPRLELGTSALSGPRSNQLSYAPGERVDRLGAIGCRAHQECQRNRPFCRKLIADSRRLQTPASAKNRPF
jgi:hypothetical protein